ncbi:MAG: helix-turn-helix domain-containing protein [Bryobacteraceae bacterium]
MKEELDRLVEHLIGNGFTMEDGVSILEKAMIAHAMKRNEGNRSAASKMLGIHRNTLQRKIAEYHMDGRKAPVKAVRRATAGRRSA